MSQQSDQQQVQDRCPPDSRSTTTKTKAVACQLATITLSPAEAALICFHKFAPLPPTNTCLKGPHTRTVLPSVLTAQAKLCQVCAVWSARGFTTRADKPEEYSSVQFVM